MLTAKQIEAITNTVQKNTLERWGVSYGRMAELIEAMDSVYPRFKKYKYTLRQAIIHLTSIMDVSNSEAMVLVQLYVVLRSKSKILLN